MNYPANVVSIHPYFKVNPGQLAAFKASMPAFIEKTRTEADNLFYEFTINGDEVFCREAYVGAAGVLKHLANVGEQLAEAFKIATLTRLESSRTRRRARSIAGTTRANESRLVHPRGRPAPVMR